MSHRRSRGRPINGWLAVDKTQGLTSTHVVNQVRAITRAAKAGHGGTLDPLATGLLPIALGEATKTVAYVMDAPKAYRFEIRFGEATDTDDAEGEVIRTSDHRPGDSELRAALGRFVGTIDQVPPVYAAVKVNGERAYDLARRGEPVALEPRTVRIDSLELIERSDAERAVLEMVCGKGAYVRAVARDLAQAFGTEAHVRVLRRLAVGPFHVDDALSVDTLAALAKDDSLPQALVPVATALADIPAFALTEPQAQRLKAGQSIMVSRNSMIDEGSAIQSDDLQTVKAMQAGELVALARLDGAELSPLRVFHL
ncbi:MAG: tRNA pseudouridine(55) synthase TruB [Geminicoccaceae bacterium]